MRVYAFNVKMILFTDFWDSVDRSWRICTNQAVNLLSVRGPKSKWGGYFSDNRWRCHFHRGILRLLGCHQREPLYGYDCK